LQRRCQGLAVSEAQKWLTVDRSFSICAVLSSQMSEPRKSLTR
jgi:hypothetical protein